MEPIPYLTIRPVPTHAIRAGELARLAGVSKDTLRYYERQRLLGVVPRGANGYRWYPAGALQRVTIIRRSLRLGFTIEELRRILAARDAGTPPCKRVRALAQQKLSELEQRLRELQQMRKVLLQTLSDWDALLVQSRTRPARLLESDRLDSRLLQVRYRKGWHRKET